MELSRYQIALPSFERWCSNFSEMACLSARVCSFGDEQADTLERLKQTRSVQWQAHSRLQAGGQSDAYWDATWRVRS